MDILEKRVKRRGHPRANNVTLHWNFPSGGGEFEASLTQNHSTPLYSILFNRNPKVGCHGSQEEQRRCRERRHHQRDKRRSRAAGKYLINLEFQMLYGCAGAR